MTITDRPSSENVTAGPPSRRGPSLAQMVSGGVLVLIGFLWLLERTGAIDVSVTAVLALATMVIGIALMLLARNGAHFGLIVLGTILALTALLTAVAPFEGFQGGIGDRVVEIQSVTDIRPDYNLAIGKLTIDLSEIGELESSTLLTASVGMGELIVIIPEGTQVRVEGAVGIGELDILGRVFDGVGINETYETTGFAQSTSRLTLDLQAFTGRLEVTYE